jgi:hypothetical protein
LRALLWLIVASITWAFAAWGAWIILFASQPTQLIQYEIYGPPSGYTHKDPVNGLMYEDTNAAVDSISFVDAESYIFSGLLGETSTIDIEAHAYSLYIKIAWLAGENACNKEIVTTNSPYEDLRSDLPLSITIHKMPGLYGYKGRPHDIPVYIVAVSGDPRIETIRLRCKTTIIPSSYRFATKYIDFTSGFSYISLSNDMEGLDKTIFNSSYIRIESKSYCVSAPYPLENIRLASAQNIEPMQSAYGNYTCFPGALDGAKIIWNSPVAASWRELVLILIGILFSIGSSAIVECVRPMIEKFK